MLRKVDICKAVASGKVLKLFLFDFVIVLFVFTREHRFPQVNDSNILGNLKFSASSLSAVFLESYDSTLSQTVSSDYFQNLVGVCLLLEL